jgi:arylsulfatase A-like enzyme
MGRHFGPWVPTALRPLLATENLLSRARAAGRMAAFANAYPSRWAEVRSTRRPAAPPLAALAAGVLTRHEEALREGRAVVSEITNEGWRSHLDPGAPHVSPAGAGRILAGVAARAELTLFAHYDTDHVGHRMEVEAAVPVLERVDAFLGGVLEALPPDTLLVIASDHGNVEDATTGHTTNPVPVIAAGPGSETVARRVRSIADVAPAILELLDIE